MLRKIKSTKLLKKEKNTIFPFRLVDICWWFHITSDPFHAAKHFVARGKHVWCQYVTAKNVRHLYFCQTEIKFKNQKIDSVLLYSTQEIYFQQSRLDSHEMKAALDLICRLISGISSSLFQMALVGTKIMHFFLQEFSLCESMKKKSQELPMLSNVTLNCQVAKIVMNSGSQSSEL